MTRPMTKNRHRVLCLLQFIPVMHWAVFDEPSSTRVDSFCEMTEGSSFLEVKFTESMVIDYSSIAWFNQAVYVQAPIVPGTPRCWTL
ncbi:hypothetical protein M758_6G160900 [Ceratodon purpureus]|uniref:Secreted protein n=1 Tax=Ceratodon purpureus TaxID=3225 RepID=A0A8T0HFV1_CERPU|nr:hypothetical protein KC19_6G167300 [Ceratodon purpureus]KAG0614234.1 hypothetical protein M758_6G160900 [Ceratodon purpureus]